MPQRDRQGAVTVMVTLAGLPQVGVPIRATVVLDTHAVGLYDVVFERAVALRMPGVPRSRRPGWKGRRAAATTARRSWCFHRSPSGGRCALS